MAKKSESETPNYDKHKKYHDLVGKLQDISDDKQVTGLASHVHQMASDYLHKNKGEDGKVNWSEKGDQEHRKFTDSLWEATADKIAKDYLGMTDQTIKELKGKKVGGVSQWEQFISTYLGGMDKDDFFERVKSEDELTIENVLKTYVNTIAGRHINYQHTTFLKTTIKTTDDMDGVASYLGDAKKHNKKSLKPLKVPKKFKSLEESMQTLSAASQYIPRKYHPDKKESYH